MSFYTRLGIFSAVMAAGLFAWTRFAPAHLTHPSGWFILAFFILATVVVHLVITKPGRSPQQFVRAFMATTSLKLFIFTLLIVIYGFIDRNSAFIFIFHFLVFYLLFTSFEVAVLYKYFRRQD
ncbi:MAG: hypothetical protein FD123_1259 [Bacteroidetes bacterium]|nr:MAG: hypothetical protein FD123_1259 [Bacteroidota bacterium]